MNKNDAIKSISKTLWDNVSPSGRNLTISEQGIFYDEIPISDSGIRSINEIVGVPNKVMNTLPIDLGFDVLSYLFGSLNRKPKALIKDNEIIKFIDVGATLLQPQKVIDIIDNKLGNRVSFDRMYAGDKSIEIYCTGQKQISVDVGDPVQCGVYVAFSPFGETMPDVTSFLQHLACTNGMLSTRNLVTFKKERGDGSDESMYNWIGESIFSAYNSVDDEIGRLLEMKKQVLNGNRDAAIEHILQLVPFAFRKSLLEAIRTSPRQIKTMYDLYYVVTYFASHNIDKPSSIRKMMLMSGDIPDHFTTCPTCHREI